MLFRRFLLIFLLAPRALAEVMPGGEVHVERSDEALACPSEQELVRAALALGRAPEVPTSMPLAVSVRFDRSGDTYRAVVTSTGAKTGERELRTEQQPDCAKLAAATAVVVSVLFDLLPPEAAASFELPPPPAQPSRPKARPPAPRPAPTPTPARAEPPRTGPPLELLVRAEGGVGYGLLGGRLSPGLGGAVGVRRGPWDAALGARRIFQRAVPFEPIPAAHVELALTLAFAEGCFAFREAPPLDVSVCAQVTGGVLSGDGRHFDSDYTTRDAWFAAGPAAAFRYPLGRFLALRLSLLGLLTLGSHALDVSGYGHAFDSPPLSASVNFGPELLIW